MVLTFHLDFGHGCQLIDELLSIVVPILDVLYVAVVDQSITKSDLVVEMGVNTLRETVEVGVQNFALLID